MKHVFRTFLALALTGVAAAASRAEATSDLRDVRYCEVIPLTQSGSTLTSWVYNTTP